MCKKSVNRTCEGLKLIFSFRFNFNYILCESYLWGIETKVFPLVLIRQLLCESYLWGIETYYPYLNHPPFLRVNRTCEGLKHAIDDDTTKSNAPCESYLWGIETSMLDFFFSLLLICVNRTCEGLKLLCLLCWKISEDWCESNLWGIETSHAAREGHLRSKVWIEPVRDWNAICNLIIFNSSSVWIEPVRDWNLKLDQIWNTYSWQCESNLWGIETLIELGNYQDACDVWIEPVRDWNKTGFKSLGSLITGVNRTCEGLKPFFVMFQL